MPKNYKKIKLPVLLLLLTALLTGCFISPNPSSLPTDTATAWTADPSGSTLETGSESATADTTEEGSAGNQTQSTPVDLTEQDPADSVTQATQATETTAAAETTEATQATTPSTESQAPVYTGLDVYFIDVGQADAALIACNGHYMLIDGGNKDDSSLIYGFLKQHNVPKLDIVVATHAHEDHVGGLAGAFNYTTADLTLCPVTSYSTDAFKNFKNYAEQKGGGITVPWVGARYELGGSIITILAVNTSSDTNESSIVLRLDFGSTSFLFTGDAGQTTEKVMIDSGKNLKADVLKVGHHGSYSATSYTFLRSVAPKYAVISCGRNNDYGHPHDAPLSRLRDAQVNVYRTDLQGTIHFHSTGDTVSIG